MDDSQKTKEQLIEELTELRRQQARFHQAEKYNGDFDTNYRMLVKNIRASMAVFDYEGKCLFINEIAAGALGKRPEDVVGQTQWDIFPEEVADRQIKRIREVIDTGNPFTDESRTFMGNGWRWFDTSLQPYFDNDGKITAVLLIAYDITARKEAEDAKLKKGENYRRLFESSPDSILIVDFEGTIIDCNKASDSITGEPPEQAIGKTIFDFGGLSDEETGRLMRFLEKARHGEINRPTVINFMMGGETRWLEAYPTLLKKDGEVIAVQVIARDITERRLAEEALRYGEQFNRAIIENSPLGISVRSQTGQLLSCNSVWKRLWGYSPDEIEDHLHRVRPELKFDHRDEYLGPLKDKVREIYEKGGYLYVPEVRFDNHPTGRQLWLSQYFYAIKDDTGEVERVVIMTEDITERKAAETALFESEENYRTLVEQANDGIVVLQDERVRFVNTYMAELLGYAIDEILDSRFIKYIAPEELDKITDFYTRRMKKEDVPSVYESALLRKDGTRIAVEFSAGLTKYKGQPADLAFVRDITDRVETETALRISEQRFRTILDSAQDSIFIKNQDLQYVHINRAMEKLFGLSAADLVQKDALHLFGNEVGEAVHELDKRVLAGEIIEDDHTFPVKGIQRTFHVIRVPMYDRDGVITGVCGIARDITERREAEEALQQSERKFRELTELLPQTVFEIDIEGKIIFTNEYGLKSFGYTQDDLDSGLNVLDLVVEKERDRIVANLATRLAGGKTLDREYNMVHKDGSLVPTLIYSAPIIEGGEVIGLRGIAVDITERKKIETELVKHRDNLEEMIRERSSELIAANEKLKREIAERRRSEQQAKESGERYRILFETSGEGILIAGYESRRFRYANPAICKLLGYSVEELVGMGVDDIHPVESLEDIHAEFERNSSMPNYVAEDIPCLKKDGSIVYVDIVGAVQYIDGVRHSVGFFRDTTERKLAHGALLESEERFRMMAELSPNAIIVIQDEKFVFMNEAALKLFGAENPEDIIGRNAFNLVHSDYKSILKERINKVTIENKPADFLEEIIYRIDGEPIYIEAASGPFSYDGKPAIQVVARDITERKRIEEALRESEMQYRTTIDAMGDSIHVINRDYKILLCNKALRNWHEKMGLPSDLQNSNLFDVYPFLDSKIRSEYENVFETGEILVTVETNEIEYGRIVTETRKIPISDGNKVVRIVTVLRDITERMLAEEALRESETWLRSTIESLPFDFFALDDEGRYILQNSVCRMHWGDLIGKTVEESELNEDVRRIWLDNNRRALSGETVEGEVDYSFAAEKGYFYNIIAPIRYRGKIKGILGLNMDITDLKRAEKELRRRTDELRSEREALEQKNIAMREVLSQIENEKNSIKLQIAANIDRVIIPAIQRLRENCDDRLKKHVDNIESSLKTVSSPFMDQLRNNYSQLTPREMEICKMIKNGLMSKEISEILNVSILTVHKHRETIRKKLGIKNKNVNLSSYLQNF